MKLDLILSQPIPVTSRLTDYFSAPKSDSMKYSIDEVGRMTQGLIDAFTQEGIKGFEKDRNIVRLHEKLLAAPERDRLRLVRELKDAKAKIYIERHDFMQMVSDFQGVCGAVAAFARPEVANQIQVVSSHFVNIGVQVAGLVGYGPLASAGAVTPIGFGSAILTAVGQISSLFAKKSGVTFERATLEAIAVLSQQIHQLREEMHSRFDDVQFQMFLMNSDIMIQFGLLHQEVGHIAQKLEHIHAAMASNHRQLEHTLSSIGQSITDLEREFTDSETRREVKKLSKLINPVLYSISGHYMTHGEFTKLSDELLAAVHSTLKQKELAGALVNLADGVIAKWQPMERSGHWVNYHINSVLAYAAATMGYRLEQAVNNPILLCYVTLALILINRRRYVASQEPFASRVSTHEVEAIETVVAEIRATQEALIPLREPRLYAVLLQQTRASVQDFQQAYEKALKIFQTTKAAELDLTTDQARTRQQATDIQRFNSQGIEPNWKGGAYRYEWFRAESKVSDGSWSRTCVPSLNSGMGEPTAGKSLSARNGYVKTIKEEFQANTRKYESLGASIIYPAEGFQGKLLPITPILVKQIFSTLPKDIQHAIELNKLQLKFQYFTKGNTEFHLQLLIENRVCYSVCLPYKMPIYTPGESEWLFWVGGTRPTGGVYCSKFGSGSHKKCTWDDQIWLPNVSQQAGYIEKFEPVSTNPMSPAPRNQAKREDIDALNILANQHIKEIYRVLREQFNESVRHQVESDHKSTLGKAVTAFDANIKKLKALLALAFPDVYSHPHDLYRLIHGSAAPLSRQDCLHYLENNPSSHGLELFEKLNEFVSVLVRHLVPLITSLKTTASNQLLDVALKELQDWLDEYKLTAVLHNEVAPLPRGMQESDALRARDLHIARLEAKLTAVGRTVNDLPSAMAETFMGQARAHLTTIVDEHPHLMGDDTAANAPSDSIARMIVGSGGPVFRMPGGNATGRTLPAPGGGTPTYKPF